MSRSPLAGALLFASFSLAALSACPQTVSGTCGQVGDPCCSGSRCDPGSECTEANVCQACGEEGEACCETGCRGGLRCENNACIAQALCGAKGEACCTGGNCLAGLRCDNASCVEPCGDGCNPGAKRCSANGGIDVCGYDVAPCTKWSAVIAKCPSGQQCQDGVCEETCPGACVLQSTLCTSEGLKVCELDEASQCPVYKVAADSPDNPVCMTGACDGPICWEGTLPQGNRLLEVTGWAADQLFLLDQNGNVVRRNGTDWAYDRRAEDGVRFNAVKNCALPTRSFAVGNGGKAWLRNGGGWAEESVGDASATLTAVACDPNARAVAVGLSGKAFARSDTGTWQALPTGTSKSFNGVGYDSFTGNAFLVGSSGTVIRCGPIYDLSQVTCAPEASGMTTADLTAAWSSTAGETIAVGRAGTVLRRAPNGIWGQVAQAVVGEDLLAVHGLESGDVYAAGANGAFLTRIGTTWSSVSFTGVDLNGVYAVDQENLFVVGDGAEIWFNDVRGLQGPPPQQHWRQIGGRAPATAPLYAVTGLGVGDVYAVGEGGTLLHKSGDAWRHEAKTLSTADLFAVTQVSADEVYAVGSGGTILARRNGVWAREGAGVTSNPLYGAWNDGHTVYAIGPNGTWLEKPVGAAGNLWALVNQPATQNLLLAIGGRVGATPAETEVYAVGTDCTLLKKIGGQFSAESLPGCNGEALTAIWVGADGELYVGGEGALILHRVGGSWEREYLGGFTLETVNALARQGDDVWAVAEYGELHHRTAGSWRLEAVNLTYSGLRGAYSTPEGHLFVVGGAGLIWHRR